MAETLQSSLPDETVWSSTNPHYKILIDLDVNCVFIKHTNKLTLDLIIERYEDIFSNSLMRPGLNYFLSYSETSNEMSPDHIRDLANYLKTKKDIRGQCKHAVLCYSNVGYGYSRMLDSLYNAKQAVENTEVSTMIFNVPNFKNPEEPYKKGLIWLGINPSYSNPF
ncbi:MAG: hypothetical protein V7750_15245 [Sneathiella sp.]